jgi:hypothetical protein
MTEGDGSELLGSNDDKPYVAAYGPDGDREAHRCVQVMWLSRHHPTPEQVRVLKEKLVRGERELYINPVSVSVKDGKEVVDLFVDAGADEMVVVLPVNILAELLTELRRRGMDIKPIRSVMARSSDEQGNVEVVFDHYERLVSVEIISHPL